MPGGSRNRKVGSTPTFIPPSEYNTPNSSTNEADYSSPGLPLISEVDSDNTMTDSFPKRGSIGEAETNGPTINTENYQKIVRQLDLYYGIVKRKILRHQSPTTGLFPRVSKDRTQAYLRDSIYCAAGVWALYQAYRRIDDDRGKAYELGQSAVKCMRGVLFSWLRQSKHIEDFKQHQNLSSALHSKFHLVTGEPIVGCHEYSHAQIDIPALYLLYLVQMIASGLQIIYTMDEVNFIQNLVYYIERAYRTADFGAWERGSKANDGTPEVHASCLGMVKAALEAVNGCNLFGEQGTAWSVIYVDIDAHNRNRSILETLLPRESSSKSCDAALLSVISYPAFATHDQKLYSTTKDKVMTKLEGEYGFKRFFRDGFGTSIEDTKRRFYHPGEPKNFDNIECEWPLFYIYLVIDGVFKNLPGQVAKYQKRLHDKLIKDSSEDAVVPMYYYVPRDCVELERQHPGSNPRVPSAAGSQSGEVFLWGQSLYLISQLLVEELLHINELDPIRRFLPSFCRPRRTNRYSAFQGTATDLVVQIVLIAESMRLQAMMATYGIQTQTPHEVEPVQIWPQNQLIKAYKHLGVNKKLGLLGRPLRPVGALGTSKVYRVLGRTILCYPLTFEVSDFYLSHDMSLLIDDIKNELTFVGRYWRLSGRPTVCLLVREEHMRDVKFKEMLDLLAMLKSGRCDTLQVRVGRVQNMIASSCMEHLDFLHTIEDEIDFTPFTQLRHASAGYQSLTDIPKYIAYSEEVKDYEEFKHKKTSEVVDAYNCQVALHGRSQLLAILLKRHGQEFPIHGQSVKELLEDISRQAGALRHWQVVRFCASSLHKMVDSISPFVTSILVNGKQVTFGILGQEEVIIDRPMNPGELRSLVYNTLHHHDPYQAVLQQELMLYIGKLISTNPRLFNGILNIRIGWIIHAVKLYVAYFLPCTETLESLSPSELRRLVYQVLNVGEWTRHSRCTPFHRRRIEGAIGRVPAGFHARVWVILSKTPGGIVVGGNHLPQQPTISDMTMQELNFSLAVDKMLSGIEQPELRQVVVELMIVLATILERNPEVTIEGKIDTDEMVNEAIGLYQKDQNIGNLEEASHAFFGIPPTITSRYLARAVVNFVLKSGATMPTEVFCAVS